MAKKTIKRSITFGAALEWLESKKAEMLNDDRLLVYKRSHSEMIEYEDGIEEADLEMQKIANSIDTIKDGIVALRGNKVITDGMVAEMNAKVDEYNKWQESKQVCINGYVKAQRLIENYDRDTEKELFFFWQLLHDMLPDLTPPWFEFKEEHKDFYYKNHV